MGTRSTPAKAGDPARNPLGTKQAILIEMLQRPEGAAMETIIAATGWQAHIVRGAMSGAMSGALGKKLGLVVTSAKEDGRGRVYRIGSDTA
jgi:hypothetical protein